MGKKHRGKLYVKMFGKTRLLGDGSGWHVCKKNRKGEFESLSGPHYTAVMARIAAGRIERGEPPLKR